jgi:phenylalanine-4-hydroxylase
LKQFDIVDIFREPYRADILQRVYYTFDDVSQIYNLINDTGFLYKKLQEARQKGEFQPLFPVAKNKYSNIGHCRVLELVKNSENA